MRFARVYYSNPLNWNCLYIFIRTVEREEITRNRIFRRHKLSFQRQRKKNKKQRKTKDKHCANGLCYLLVKNVNPIARCCGLSKVQHQKKFKIGLHDIKTTTTTKKSTPIKILNFELYGITLIRL